MPRKQTQIRKEKLRKKLTLTQLKCLVVAHLNLIYSKQAELKIILEQVTGIKVEEDFSNLAIRDKFVDRISNLISRGLKRRRSNISIVSDQDFRRLVTLLMDDVFEDDVDESDMKSRIRLEQQLVSYADNLIKGVRLNSAHQKNKYEAYWRWIMTVLNLATERGINPVEFIALEEAYDKIKRRMFTKKQYTAFSKNEIESIDVNAVIKLLIQPVLEMAVDDLNEEELLMFSIELEKEIRPAIQGIVEKCQTGTAKWIKAEVERIYAVA